MKTKLSVSRPLTKLAPFAVLLGGVYASHAWAQTLPNAGDVMRDNAAPKINATPKGNVTEPVVPLSTISKDTTPIPIRDIQVKGATVFAASALEEIVAKLKGGTYTLGEIQSAVDRISVYYRKEGYFLARAYIPEQDMKDGVLLIQVMEGRYDQTRIENKTNLSNETILGYLGDIKLGAAAEKDSFDRALLNLMDVPGVGAVNTSIEAGSKAGYTAVLVKAQPEPVVTGQLGLDNYGQYYSGKNRITGNLDGNNALGAGERLTGQFMVTDQHLFFGSFGAQMPIGYSGLVANLSVGRTQYLLGQTYAALNAQGFANSAKWGLKYPLVRSLALNVYATGGLEHRKLHDVIASTGTNTDKRLTVSNLAISMDGQDDRHGMNQASLMLSKGRLSIDSSSALALDQSSAYTNGGYSKLNWSLARMQGLSNDWSLSAQVRGQYTARNLDSSEKFGLGGATGVRAYPSGEAGGDKGAVASLDLRYGMTPTVSLGMFYDAGTVTVNAVPYLATPNNRTLAGSGLGIYSNEKAWTGSASVAWRTVGGTAVSQPDKKPVAWLSAGYRF